MTNLDNILKSKDITLPTKVRLVKAMVFPMVTYSCESWTVKKAEHWRIDAFELWCWRRLLRVPWTARRSNQFILKEISPRCSLEGMMLKLKLQYFGHLMWRADSLEKLMLGGIEGRMRRGWQRMRWLDGITDSIDVSLSEWWTGRPGVLQFMGSQRVGQDWVTELKWSITLFFLEFPSVYFVKICFAGGKHCCQAKKLKQTVFSSKLVYSLQNKLQCEIVIALHRDWKVSDLNGHIAS